jgi:3-oxoacyl-[acyl-carrier protein] reductase
MTGMRRFEEIAVGDSATIEHVVTADDVRRFVELTGDDNPLHVDRAYAESTPFKDIVVHGMLGASFLSTLIGTRLPGPGALWISQSFDFLLPVRLGDALTVSATVTGRHERDRLLDMEARIENQRGQTVLRGTGTVRVPEPPTAAAEPPQRELVAVVAGATGGIGRAVCRSLAREGYRLVLAYWSGGERAAALAAELTAVDTEAVAVRADLTDPGAAATLVETAIRRFGTVGAIVHAASPAIDPVPVGELSWASVETHLDAGARAGLALVQAALPAMRAQRQGRIVFVTSGVLDGAPTPAWTAYAVGKAALAQLARSLAVELGPDGITVNCVSPGMTDTALVADITAKARLVVARQAPLRRLASPEDVASAVAFLLSDGAAYITGETIRVNGGRVTL